jgi:serine/threonine protein kinase
MENLIGQTIAQYRIIEQIGQGGMATVYKAYQPSLDRYVAFKVLPEYYVHDRTFLARFQREAKVIANLSHPHILPVYDFGQVGNLTYIVMQYIEGGTLKDIMGRPISLSQMAHFADQIATALDYAHQRGVLHRDVKPGNILLEEGRRVLLTDFGLAKMVEGAVQLTGSGVGVGTPTYMSPEQGQGLAVDARTDVYALGIILYEMVTGRAPYQAETPMAVVIKHISAPLPLPRSFNPNLPEGVERVILKTLAKNKEERYASAGQMVSALHQALAVTPDEAGPTLTPALYRQPSQAGLSPVTEGWPGPTTSRPQSPSTAPVGPMPAPPPPGHPPAQPAWQTSPGATPRSGSILPWILGGGLLLVVLLILAGLAGFFLINPSGSDISMSANVDQPKPLEAVVAEAQATEDAQEQSTPTAADQAREAATAKAQQEHRATATVQAQMVATAQANPPLFGPGQGSLAHEAEGHMEAKFAGVEVRDFVVEVVFHTPYSKAKGDWDMGLLFRHTEGNEHFGLVIDSKGDWSLGNQRGSETDIIAEGSLTNIAAYTGNSNRLKLVAENERGTLFVNDMLVAQFDLSSRTNAGDIAVAIGFYSGHEIDGEATAFEAFTIWPITAQAQEVVKAAATARAQIVTTAAASPRIFGPENGNLFHQVDDLVKGNRAGVDVRNFVVEVRFDTPYPTTRSHWDAGLVFREVAANDQFRLVIESTGQWNLWDWRGSEGEVIDEGWLSNLEVSANSANRLKLIARDNQGFLFLNDNFVTELDLSRRTNAGDIGVATGFHPQYELAGEVTTYGDFTIRELP